MIAEAGLASLGCLGDRPIWFRLSLFSPAVMTGTTLAVVALLAGSAAAILRDAFDRRHGAAVPANALVALWLVALFLVVFSSKLLLMRQTPVTTPFWDQWDAEAASLLVPASECRLTWA